MNQSKSRLIELLEYAKQTALLKKNPATNYKQHKEFAREEKSLIGLPGISLNIIDDESDEVWMRVERLRESHAPIPTNKLLAYWIQISASPNNKPTLKRIGSIKELFSIGAIKHTASKKDEASPEDDCEHPDDDVITLDEYLQKDFVVKQLQTYIDAQWVPWAEKEIKVRRCIATYSDLFVLSQKMQGNLVDTQLELVWGQGVATWSHKLGKVVYPILTQLAEISLDEQTMAIEIRPRSVDARIELDPYVAMGNPGVANVEAAGRSLYGNDGISFNPFEPTSFEPFLQAAVTFLDPKGEYADGVEIPIESDITRAGDSLRISNSWVLFARPRTGNIFIQDLDRFIKVVDDNQTDLEVYPAICSLVNEPSDVCTEEVLQNFRGLSFDGNSLSGGSGKIHELYFPKPYNDEQVKIIQLLHANDGVIVQGPPGTGKTHTIANIVCHYLASGKRVLVTSMKDPALSVLQEKIPEEIRALSISLLSSEVDGLKQFEDSIGKIAAEISRIDKTAYAREINSLECNIDAIHERISIIDRSIAKWAKLNLQKVTIGGEEFDPLDVAKQVSENRETIAWFPDRITIKNDFDPRFSTEDIINLRSARRIIGKDYEYLGVKIPDFSRLPDATELGTAHTRLLELQNIQQKAKENKSLVLLSDENTFVASAKELLEDLLQIQLFFNELNSRNLGWTNQAIAFAKNLEETDLLESYRALSQEISSAITERRRFMESPVEIPNEFCYQQDVIDAVINLASGKLPFGIAGIIGKQIQKRILAEIRVTGKAPASSKDWTHVSSYLAHHEKCYKLVIRWNAFATETLLPTLECKADKLVEANAIAKTLNQIIATIQLCNKAEERYKSIIGNLDPETLSLSEPKNIQVARGIISHNLLKIELSDALNMKPRVARETLGCGGKVTHEILNVLENRLGNPLASQDDIQSQWSEILDQLRHIKSLTEYKNEVYRITDLIAKSGAINWSARLRSESVLGTTDTLLPDNWAETWKLSRLANHVDEIDCREELKRLSRERTDLEHDLSISYVHLVEKRTWLKIAENATHEVRAALEAYKAAIKKIGKGTGIRAGRYRHDARMAAERANFAIPCWIMPHYRISESLPSKFGFFDLVIIDEASQSDLSALPAILRAKKILVVGDDKQVSPEGIGLEEEKIKSLMSRFLSNQVDIYRPQMAPDRSIYDLFKVVFSKSSTMLREHFRCANPIIEFSKREFYNHELIPLRVPKSSERIEPPLVDVFVENGFRKGDTNDREANFIVEEIKRIVDDPSMNGRTIGVVPLIGNEQALKIMQMLEETLGEEVITKFRITCGDARTFQGKERDIMFLSMIATPSNVTAQTQDMIAQRYNVAASRARDRMYLIRSLGLEDLSPKDALRSKLIRHFQSPFIQEENVISRGRDLCESPFEREMYDLLIERGYKVIPQVKVGNFRIDMVVEGKNDNRLAIECDGDQYHGPDKWDSDMRRQRILERAGWKFWRCFASAFVTRRSEVLSDLLQTLSNHDIEPVFSDDKNLSIHVEARIVKAEEDLKTICSSEEIDDDHNNQQFNSYSSQVALDLTPVSGSTSSIIHGSDSLTSIKTPTPILRDDSKYLAEGVKLVRNIFQSGSYDYAVVVQAAANALSISMSELSNQIYVWYNTARDLLRLEGADVSFYDDEATVNEKHSQLFQNSVSGNKQQ